MCVSTRAPRVAAILSKARCLVSPDVNVGRRLSLIGIPLGSASVRPCLHAQIRNTRAEAEELSSAINTNLQLLFFAEANNPFQNDRNVATLCILLQQFCTISSADSSRMA